MNILDGNKTLILALMQLAVGLFLLWQEDKETGMAFVTFALASIGVRDATSGPPAWRQPRARRSKPVIGGEE